jgi:hypothetical protein
MKERRKLHSGLILIKAIKMPNAMELTKAVKME